VVVLNQRGTGQSPGEGLSQSAMRIMAARPSIQGLWLALVLPTPQGVHEYDANCTPTAQNLNDILLLGFDEHFASTTECLAVQGRKCH